MSEGELVNTGVSMCIRLGVRCGAHYSYLLACRRLHARKVNKLEAREACGWSTAIKSRPLRLHRGLLEIHTAVVHQLHNLRPV